MKTFLAAAAATLAAPAFAETKQAFVILPVTEAAHESFMQVMQANIAGSRAEAGNISFDVFRAEDGSPGVFLVERWQDQAALDSHMDTDHLQAVNAAAGDAVEGQPQQIWLQELPELPALPADDAVTPRNVVVMFDTSDDTRDDFLAAMAKAVPPSRAADGNHGFNLFQIEGDPNRFVAVEHWASAEQHEAHLAADYSQQLNADLEGLLTADPMESRWLLSEIPAEG